MMSTRPLAIRTIRFVGSLETFFDEMHQETISDEGSSRALLDEMNQAAISNGNLAIVLTRDAFEALRNGRIHELQQIVGEPVASRLDLQDSFPVPNADGKGYREEPVLLVSRRVFSRV